MNRSSPVPHRLGRACSRRPGALLAVVILGVAASAACAPAPVQVLALTGDASATDALPPLVRADAGTDQHGGLDGGLDAAPPDTGAPAADTGTEPHDAGLSDGVFPLCPDPSPSQDVLRAALPGVSRADAPARITSAGEVVHVVGLGADGAFAWSPGSDTATPVAPVPLGLIGMTHVESLLPDPIDDGPLPTFRSPLNGGAWGRGQATATFGTEPVESYVRTPEGLVLVTSSVSGGAIVHHVQVGLADPIEHVESVGPYHEVRGLLVGGQAWLVSRQNWDFPDTIFVQSAENGTWMWGPHGIAYDVDATVVRGIPRFFVVADGNEGVDFAMVQPTDDAPVHVFLGTHAPTVPSHVTWSAQRSQVLVGTALDAERIAVRRFDAEARAIGSEHVLHNPSTVAGAQLRWFALTALQDHWAVLMGVDEGTSGSVTLYVSEVSFCP